MKKGKGPFVKRPVRLGGDRRFPTGGWMVPLSCVPSVFSDVTGANFKEKIVRYGCLSILHILNLYYFSVKINT